MEGILVSMHVGEAVDEGTGNALFTRKRPIKGRNGEMYDTQL